MRRKLSQPIITLTTDFGLSDSYVAEMKAVILRECPNARLIDVTHMVPRHDVLYGSIMLERALSAFESGTVHLAVVDPGVGSPRRLIVCEIAKQWIVCPDNGLITWPTRVMGDAKVHEITWRPKQFSSTFHGRDILGPVAARVAATQSLRGLAIRATGPVLLKVSIAPGSSGEIIHFDSFGNALTNLRIAKPQATATVKGKTVPIYRSYSDVAIGKPLALVGSANLLEIAVREGSAQKKLKLKVGDEVVLK